MMNKDEQRIIFLKKRILNRLKEVQECMSNTKYKLYKTMVNDCNSFDEIREIAELDMQLGLIDYVRKLKYSLNENNISIGDIEAINNYSDKPQKLSLILPSKNINQTQKLDDIDISTLGEDIEDEEVLAAASSILLSRLNAIPPEELYREQIEDYEDDELSEEHIDDIDVSYDDLYGNSEDADEEDDELDFDDIDESELGIDDEEEDDEEDELDFDDIDESELGIDEDEKQDINDIVPDFSNETDDEDDELDFGNNESNDIDNISDDDIFIDNDDESDNESDDESEDTDWDSLGDDLFEEGSNNFDDDSDEESDDTDWDSLCDDLFEECSEDGDESDDESDDTDWDSLGDDLFEEDNDNFDDDSDDESDDDISSLDNIDADDLFCDDDSEDEYDEDGEDDEDDDALSDIDNIEDDSDEFDLDDTDFEYDEPTDDAESFDDFFKSKNVNDINNKKKKRDVTQQKIFINGSRRGQQTQDMFNMLNNMFGGFGRAGSKLGNTFKKSIKACVDKINKSSFFNLSGQ